MNARKYVPSQEAGVVKQIDRLIDKLHRLPKGKEAYGLIHGDLHTGNMAIDRDHLTVFDFDDSCYSWFICDIAFILHYVLPRLPTDTEKEEDEAKRVSTFLSAFMAGYRTENQLEDSWWQTVPDFLKFRRALLYIFYHQVLDMDNLSSKMIQKVKQTRREIEEDVPVTRLSFFESAEW